MIKKYLIADSTLENEDELKQSLGNEGFKKYLQDNKIKIIEVLKLSDLKKEIEELQNPYPEDIFPIPTKQEWKKFHKILEEKNLTQDKFFGYFGRLVWNNCKERLLKELLG